MTPQLSKLSYGAVTGLLRGTDLLADARRRVAALGAAVDPLFDTRKLQQVCVCVCVCVLENEVCVCVF